jgi:hypothetical protein
VSRRDRSSVGIVGGEVCPEPLQGLHRAAGGCWAGEFPTHRSGLPWPRTVDGCRNGICKTLVHTLLFDGAKIHFSSYTGKAVLCLIFSPRHAVAGHVSSEEVPLDASCLAE